MRFAIFQNVDRASEIVFEQLARAGFAVNAGQHAGIGGGINRKIGGRQSFKIRRAANIRMNYFYAELCQFAEVVFTTRTDEVVHAKDLEFSADSSNALASVLPTKPQMPVMKIFMR